MRQIRNQSLGSPLEKQSSWCHYHGTISWWHSFWTLWWKLVAPYFPSVSSEKIHDSRRNRRTRDKWRVEIGTWPSSHNVRHPCDSYLVHRNRRGEWWCSWEWGSQGRGRWLRYWPLISAHENTFQKGGKDTLHHPKEAQGKRCINQR